MIGRKKEPEQTGDSPTHMAFIANGMRIQGSCETAGELRIEGHVTGDVRAGSLEMTRTSRVDGDVLGPDADKAQPFVIHGRVGGAVRAARVEIGREGHVDGGVAAVEAVVHGRVSGGVVAQHRLILEETGVVEGDVRAHRLALKEGGMVNGDIRMGDRAAEPEGGSRTRSNPPQHREEPAEAAS